MSEPVIATQLLDGKVAVIYGAGGHIGSATAAAFTREGAHVVLAGRSAASLGEAAAGLTDAETAVVDATDADAVDAHLDRVIAANGRVDISLNVIGIDDVQGRPLVELGLDEFLTPITIAMQGQFVTATAAARRMSQQRRGVILAATATPARLALPLVGGFGPACGAIEALLRGLAAEVGDAGVRVCWIRSAGSPESFGPDVAADAEGRPTGLGDETYLSGIRDSTLLRRFPTIEEVADAAVLLASDRAAAVTGAAVNLTCGQIVD
jgi:3-oxoacyl-[acyl-carrier protein] reductase